MITIPFRMTVNAERDNQWRELLSQLTRSTRSDASWLRTAFADPWADGPRDDLVGLHLGRNVRRAGREPLRVSPPGDATLIRLTPRAERRRRSPHGTREREGSS